MAHQYAKIAFTDNVSAAQEHYGSTEQNRRLLENAGPNDKLSQREATFIAQQDTFYLSTVSESGWPYVQHRGGPTGFLKMLNPGQLIYPDFRGNAQLISTGNVVGNSRCSLLLMDYANKKRLKILGRLRISDVSESSGDLVDAVAPQNYAARVERIGLIDVVAFDWNCPQHITPRYTAEQAALLTIGSQ